MDTFTTTNTGSAQVPCKTIRGVAAVRASYSRHFLKAHIQGFKPLGLREFVGVLSSINLAK